MCRATGYSLKPLRCSTWSSTTSAAPTSPSADSRTSSPRPTAATRCCGAAAIAARKPGTRCATGVRVGVAAARRFSSRSRRSPVHRSRPRRSCAPTSATASGTCRRRRTGRTRRCGRRSRRARRSGRRSGAQPMTYASIDAAWSVKICSIADVGELECIRADLSAMSAQTADWSETRAPAMGHRSGDLRHPLGAAVAYCARGAATNALDFARQRPASTHDTGMISSSSPRRGSSG